MEYVHNVMAEKVAAIGKELDRIRSLPKQVAYILMRYCIQGKLVFWQRNLPTRFTEGPAKIVSSAMRETFRHISDGPEVLLDHDDALWDHVAMPLALGGMGFHDPVNTNVPQRLAAMSSLLFRPERREVQEDHFAFKGDKDRSVDAEKLHRAMHPIIADALKPDLFPELKPLYDFVKPNNKATIREFIDALPEDSPIAKSPDIMEFLSLWETHASQGPLVEKLGGVTGAAISNFVTETAGSGQRDKSPAATLLRATNAHVFAVALQAQADPEMHLRMHLNTVSCSAVWRAIPSRRKLEMTDEQFETAVGLRYWPRALKDGKAHTHDCVGSRPGKGKTCQVHQTGMHRLKCPQTAGYGITERHDSVVAELIYYVRQAGARWARDTGSLAAKNITIAQQKHKRPWDLLLMSPSGQQIAIDVGVTCAEDPTTHVEQQLHAMQTEETKKNKENARQGVRNINTASNMAKKKAQAKTKVPPPDHVRAPKYNANGKCTNPLTVAEHAEHKENTRFIPFILESSGVYGEEAQRFMREVSQWAFDEGFRPDHFEENMRRSIGMALTKANTSLVIRASHLSGKGGEAPWTKPYRRLRMGRELSMQFDVENTRARTHDGRSTRRPSG